MRTRPLAFLLLWMSRFEQLFWGPLLPLLFLAVTAGDAVRAATFNAIALSAFSLANLVGNLLAGPALDRWGRYFLSGIGLLLMALTAGLHSLVAAPVALVSVHLLHGLFAAIISPASLAIVGDSAPRARRAEAMARAGIIIAFATTLGTVISGRVADKVSPEWAVSTIAIMLAVSGLVTVVFGRRADKEAQLLAADDAPTAGTGARPFNPGLAAMAAAMAFVLFFAQNVFLSRMPFDARELGLSSSFVGVLYAVFSVASIIAFAPPFSRLGDRFGRRTALLLGFAVIAGSLTVVSFAGTPLALTLGLFAYGIGFGLTFPAIAALSTDAGSMQRRGMSFGVFTAASSGGAFVGPLVTNALRDVMSPYLVTSIVVVGAIVAAAVWQEQRCASNASVI